MFENIRQEFYLILVLIFVINCSNLPKDCGDNGQHFDESSWRIVGGQKANHTEWPWMVALKLEYSGFPVASCGGALIHEDWILTAAHCVYGDDDPDKYFVYLGYSDLDQKSGHELKVAVNKIIKHEKFNITERVNDLALVQMNHSIHFDHNYRPVCLPNIANEWTDDCMATGYGYHSAAGDNDRSLMKVLEPVFDIRKCNELMDHIHQESNICAGGSAKGGSGTCMGDSGGPLQCRAKDGKWYEVGITSWGDPCANANVPDVFTRVAFYRGWIEGVIQQN